MKLFHFPSLQKEETSTLLAEEAPTKAVELGNLDMAFSKLDDNSKFEDLGGCPVPFRASVVRIVFFKLFGTGILAGLIALAQSTDRETSISCALAAAVNAIACVHYYLIWKTRAQDMPVSYKAWGAAVPRTSPDPKRVRNLVFAQETAVDGWRCVCLSPHHSFLFSHPTLSFTGTRTGCARCACEAYAPLSPPLSPLRACPYSWSS